MAPETAPHLPPEGPEHGVASSAVRAVGISPLTFLPFAALAVFLIVWEIVGRAMNPLLFAPPSEVADAAVELVVSGRLQQAFVVTLWALAVGLALSIVSGLPFGIALGRLPKLARVAEPYIDAIYATPRVVLTPLIILWLGIGFSGRVFIIWIGAVIPLILSTAIGVRQARPDLVEVAQSFQASERQLIRHVIMPAAVPYVLAGLRIAVGRALIGVVIAEMFLDLTGVGGMIREEAARFRVPEALTGILVFALLGTLLIGAVGWLEKRFSTWKGEGS